MTQTAVSVRYHRHQEAVGEPQTQEEKKGVTPGDRIYQPSLNTHPPMNVILPSQSPADTPGVRRPKIRLYVRARDHFGNR